MDEAGLPGALLPPGVRSRFVPDVSGLRMHILEAGFDPPGRPLVLLLHGFPELAFSWRKVMPPLAAAGYHVLAPDQRGFGRTTGWDGAFDGDLASFRPFSLVQDLLSLLFSVGNGSATAVVGHDFGSPVAAHCALLRPDIFTSVVMMSAPFAGPPPAGSEPAPEDDVHGALARLTPPRQHYQWYYSTRQAAADMIGPPQGLHDFLRAYFHVKSGDWPGNQPYPLNAFNPGELARLPSYYVMPGGATMPQAVAPYLPPAAQAAACPWLTEAELGVYCGEFARTGFQGGLQWYRCATSGLAAADLRLFAGRAIEVPALYVAGEADWGTYQVPGVFGNLGRACADLRGRHLVPGAGHWVQQEQPDEVNRLLLKFLKST